jgi:hypothetical protein
MYCIAGGFPMGGVLFFRIVASAGLLLSALQASPGISVTPAGDYDVTFTTPAWRFGGELGTPASNIANSAGSDALGDYSEVSFDYTANTPRHASIRAYDGRNTVLFSVEYARDAANVAPFPTLSRYPMLPYHLTYSGYFAIPSFPGFGDEGPWIFFDGSANTFVLSPAANYLLARTTHGRSGEIAAGISSKVATLPAGFRHQTILTVDSSVNRAFDTWGHALTDLSGKVRPASDASTFLNQLGYWTDAGATYYYSTEPGMSYMDTLSAVKADFDRSGVVLGYLQLDSWFYPKGPLADWHDGSGGIYEYAAAPALFAPDLRDFQQSLGIPLITHARWIDASSPVRSQYRMSGNVSIDPNYWKRVADYLATSGVRAYEQDWLGDMAHTDFNLSDPYLFLDSMAAAMADRGLTMQYCMATPSQFLQSTKYGNLTDIRVSEDRFDRTRWNELLITGRLASALGVWPFADNLLSSETENMLLATLSAGPLGLGDRISSLSRDNLLRAVRADGVIVKPDAPIVPLDRSWIETARGSGAPMVASTYTDFGGMRAHYVFAYGQGDNALATFRPADLGISDRVFVYNFFAGSGRIVAPSDVYAEPMTDGRAYYVIAPVGPSGIALLGDRGHFVTLGRKRITSLTDDGAVHVTVSFAAGESRRTLFGFAPSMPMVMASTGGAGDVSFDAATGIFSVELTPGPDRTASCLIQ